MTTAPKILALGALVSVLVAGPADAMSRQSFRAYQNPPKPVYYHKKINPPTAYMVPPLPRNPKSIPNGQGFNAREAMRPTPTTRAGYTPQEVVSGKPVVVPQNKPGQILPGQPQPSIPGLSAAQQQLTIDQAANAERARKEMEERIRWDESVKRYEMDKLAARISGRPAPLLPNELQYGIPPPGESRPLPPSYSELYPPSPPKF